MGHQSVVDDCMEIEDRHRVASEHQIDVKKSGFICKQSRVLKIWRKRWFVLTSDCLYAFKSEDIRNQMPTEQISLNDCSSVRALAGTSKDYILRVETPERTFLLGAASEVERDAWIEAIHDCCLSLFLDDSICRRISKFSIPESEHEDESEHETNDAEEVHESESKEGNIDVDSKNDESSVSRNTLDCSMNFCLKLIADTLF
eukprot:CAMPEP_0169112792 /NCGR_PEP_ID=MMETSP1015-20121227/27830_1 /TAXON_ID=342587 /ORGANISM="Karlodinium micrum, Strain CCMP2283" /LENGTH=201 /DNA_ID=CAMNT_0009174865 /DNA_START=58 /DNA_END=663 /DNA_ORIENTATION=+